MVYYREGYVPQNYDQQVSADRSAPRSCPCCGFERPHDLRGICPVLDGLVLCADGTGQQWLCSAGGVPGTHTIRK